MGDASDLFYGLATAFGYGTGDFLARQASHRIGHLQVLFYMEAGSLLVLLPVAFALERDLWNLGPGLAWLAGLGVVNVVASLFLYRSFEYGVLSVVSPLASRKAINALALRAMSTPRVGVTGNSANSMQPPVPPSRRASRSFSSASGPGSSPPSGSSPCSSGSSSCPGVRPIPTTRRRGTPAWAS